MEQRYARMITRPQLRKLIATFNEQGCTRDERLAAASAVLCRRVETFNDLGQDEASHLIDRFEQMRIDQRW